MTTTFTHTLTSPLFADPTTGTPIPVVHTVTMEDADFQTLATYLVARFSVGQTPPAPADAVLMWLKQSYQQMLEQEAAWRRAQQTPPTPTPLPITVT